MVEPTILKEAPPTERGPCPICGAREQVMFMELAQVPVHCNLLWDTHEEAREAPRGDMALGYCPVCSHVYNYAFDPAHTAYAQSYENSLHFSARFQQYAEGLAKGLIATYGLRGKHIIEIGCGKGDFLRQICSLGANRGLGFDKSYVPDPEHEGDTVDVRFVVDFFSEAYAHEPADMIICRHVLEHIEHPVPFLASVRKAIPSGRSPVVFFEVPDVRWTLRDMGIWDLIYEHCSYFSPGSLAYAFETAGFTVLEQREEFGGQFLTLTAVPAPAPPTRDGVNVGSMAEDVAAFAENYRAKVAYWRSRLDELARAGRRVVVWGSGSKGVTFLNTFRDQSPIEYVVDINPRKVGRYVAGTGQEIVAPAFLRKYKPDTVIIMNAIYTSEIGQMLEDQGVTATIECA